MYLTHKRLELHTVPEFLKEAVKIDENGEVASTKLFKAYVSWCDRNGLTAIGRNRFYGEVIACIPSAKRTKVQVANQQLQGFKGIWLNATNTGKE